MSREPAPIRRLLTALAAALALPGTASAASLASCGASTTPVMFGNYNPLAGTAATSTGAVSVSCGLVSGISLFVSYSVALSRGSGSYTTRTLTSNSNILNYNLYSDSNYTTVWGDGSSGTSAVSDTYLLGIGTITRTYTTYGKIPALQNAVGGAYTDYIVVTVTY